MRSNDGFLWSGIVCYAQDGFVTLAQMFEKVWHNGQCLKGAKIFSWKICLLISYSLIVFQYISIISGKLLVCLSATSEVLHSKPLFGCLKIPAEVSKETGIMHGRV